MKVSKSTQIGDTMKLLKNGQTAWLRYITLISVICVYIAVFFGDTNAQALGARSAGLGGAAYSLPSDYWGVYGNPANLPLGTWVATSIKRSFGMSELDEPAFAAGTRFKQYRISIGMSTVGWNRFRMMQTTLAAAGAFGNISTGLALDVHHLVVPDPYLNDQAILFHAGMQWNVSEQISSAVSIGNLTGSKWIRGQSELERNLRIGANWRPSEPIMIVFEGHFSDRFEADWITALEWMPIDSFWIRSGFGSANGRMSFGLGYEKMHVKTGVFAQRHDIKALGWTKGIELIIVRGA